MAVIQPVEDCHVVSLMQEDASWRSMGQWSISGIEISGQGTRS